MPGADVVAPWSRWTARSAERLGRLARRDRIQNPVAAVAGVVVAGDVRVSGVNGGGGLTLLPELFGDCRRRATAQPLTAGSPDGAP